MVLKENGSLMKVKSIAEWSILQFFWPAFSDYLICIENQFLVFFLTGHLRQVLLYSYLLFYSFVHRENRCCHPSSHMLKFEQFSYGVLEN